jgi:chromosome segregation ATPase
MAQRKLTETIILAAISEIVGRGEQPSTTLIHDQVGNIGSFATINKVFHPWRDNHEKNLSDLPTEVLLPADLEESFIQLAKKVWTQATKISNNELEKQREALAQVEHEVKLELSSAIKIGEVSENARTELQEQLDKQTALNNELTEKAILLEKENEMLKEQVKETEQLKTKNQEQSTQLAVSQSKMDEAMAIIQNTKSDLKVEQSHNEQLKTKIENQTQSILTMNNQEATSKGEIKRLKAELIEHETTFKAVQEYSDGEKVELKEAINGLNVQLKESENDRIALSRQVGSTEGRVSQMQSQLDEQKQTYDKLLNNH